MDIGNNTILITGGGSGIGLALAKEFLKYDNRVIINGRNIEKLKGVKHEIPKLEILPCDISDEDSVIQLVQEVNQNYPTLNFLVNNAGVMNIWNVQSEVTSVAQQKNEILTNIFGSIQLTQSLIPNLLKQKRAHILNVSSALAFVPLAAAPVYSATKAALHSYSISIRQQLENTNVDVFELLPAAIETEMSKDIEKCLGVKNEGPIMSPEKLALLTIRALKRDVYEIRPKVANVLYNMHRLLPSLTEIC